MKKFSLLAVTALIFVFCSHVNSQIRMLEEDKKITEKSELYRDFWRRYNRKNPAKALALVEEAIRQNKDLSIAYELRSHIRYYFENNSATAIADLDRAIAAAPERMYLYYKRAGIKNNTDDYAGALADFKIVQNSEPESTMIVLRIAEVQTNLKDYDGALKTVDQSLAKYPEDISLHTFRSSIFRRKNDFGKAILYLESFLDAYRQKRNGQLPKVRGEKIITKKVSDGNETYTRKHTEVNLNASSYADYLIKDKDFQQAKLLSEAYIELAKLYLYKDNDAKAFANLATSLEIDPHAEDAFGIRGAMYLSKNNYQAAIVEFDKAINIANVASYFLNRGIAHLALGNAEKAESDFKYFLRIKPESENILKERKAELEQKLKNPPSAPK